MNWTKEANRLADAIRPAGATPVITTITGHPGLVVVVARTADSPRARKWLNELKRSYRGLKQEVYGVARSKDGTKVAIVVEESDHHTDEFTDPALFPAADAAMVVMGRTDGVGGEKGLRTAQSSRRMEAMFAALLSA